MLHLIVVKGSERGRAYKLEEKKMHLVGRLNGSLPLSDRAVSRIHAEISFYAGQWYINDMCSTNGTYLNGGQVARQIPLQNGDQVRIGSTVFLVDLSAYKEKKIGGVLPPPPPRRTIKVGHLVDEAPQPGKRPVDYNKRPRPISPVSYKRNDSKKRLPIAKKKLAQPNTPNTPTAAKSRGHSFLPIGWVLVAITTLAMLALLVDVHHFPL